ncbi:MAG: NADH-quinone oxidoreductase subunit NuoG [Colwellia sp.]|nr:NADH-quinone oxidoreductase subunit NuoG [Colwellia sp.]MCW8864547.1 NADH-quinone oxidoreductase subunit NuoG [Colwellia sp.]MCW9082217.1 NADH-quinone oxidoreductase subunit NuoG [Colwellia sp.]
MTAQNKSSKVTIYIDDIPYQVSTDNNLLAGVLSNKLNLPYFCWHPSMGSVGACRQCAVTQYQDENDTRGRMIMSCMTPVVDGMRIGLKDSASSKFREQIIAAMMTNHPHDCPVCAEGGECHLQDMTVITGHTSRDYCGEKRTFTNQYLGELVGHEMNRCITCYRCVRFYKDYAGGKDFDVFGSRNQVYFGRQKEGCLESPFSGNLVEVCPTGVFTNKLFSAHYTRKWDLQSAPSICAHCSVGCNTSIGERYGSVRRVTNRYNHDLNGYFLCDRGRFGIGFVNASHRIRTIKGINTKAGEPVTGAFNEKSFTKAMLEHNREHFIGIGSARASFEGNRLLKYLVGRENFSLGYTNEEMKLALRHKQLLAQYPQQSLAGMENLSRRGHGELQHDLVLIIGENLEQTAPRLALTIKQVLRNSALDKADSIGVKHWQDAAVRTYAGDTTTPLFSLQAQRTSFDELAKGTLCLSPDNITMMVERLTQMLHDDFATQTVVPLKEQASEKTTNDTIDNKRQANESLDQDSDKFLLLLARTLSKASAPLIVSGLSLKSTALLSAIDDLMACLSQKSHGIAPELTMVAPECNSVGNLHFLSEHSLSIEQILARLTADQDSTALTPKGSKTTSLLILEQDLAQISAEQLNVLREHCKCMIVLEHSKTRLTDIADIVLPVAAVSESGGHFVNYQGRLQAFYSAHLPVKPIMPNWQYLVLLAKSLFTHSEIDFSNLKQLYRFFAKHGEPWALQILTCDKNAQEKRQVARQTHRASGRTAVMANQSVHEVKTYVEGKNNKDELYAYSMEGTRAAGHGMPFTWAPAWNSNQSVLQYQQEVNGELACRQNENFLHLNLSAFFDESESHSLTEKLEQLWPSPQWLEKEQNCLVLMQNLPWFLVDQQSKNLPEFILMFAGNKLSVSSTLAQQYDFKVGDIAKLTLSGQSFFAQINLADKLPNGVIQASIFELPMLVNNCTLAPEQLTKANQAEVAEFSQCEELRIVTATQEKSDILVRLKSQDQMIPIAFVNGEGEQND